MSSVSVSMSVRARIGHAAGVLSCAALVAGCGAAAGSPAANTSALPIFSCPATFPTAVTKVEPLMDRLEPVAVCRAGASPAVFDTYRLEGYAGGPQGYLAISFQHGEVAFGRPQVPEGATAQARLAQDMLNAINDDTLHSAVLEPGAYVEMLNPSSPPYVGVSHDTRAWQEAYLFGWLEIGYEGLESVPGEKAFSRNIHALATCVRKAVGLSKKIGTEITPYAKPATVNADFKAAVDQVDQCKTAVKDLGGVTLAKVVANAIKKFSSSPAASPTPDEVKPSRNDDQQESTDGESWYERFEGLLEGAGRDFEHG